MRLVHRLNLSFGILLLFVLAITAALIYLLIFDVLVDRQRQEMHSQASLLAGLTAPAAPITTVEAARVPILTSLPAVSLMVDTVLFANDEQVLYSNLPAAEATRWVQIAKHPDLDQGVWQEVDDQYIVEMVSLPIEIDTAPAEDITIMAPAEDITAIMAVPVSEIQSVQHSLFLRLMIILFVGAALAFVLSTLVTRRLVKPLAKLQQELKKVENRRFSEVQLIQAGGEIGEVAGSVYQLSGVLEQYQRTQKQFFQNVSHELKTPLTSIQGYAEGIKDGVFAGTAADKGLDTIANECVRLKKIVTEMILLAKLESEEGIFHMEKVAVRDLLMQTLERINPLLVKRELHIQMSGDEHELYIYADREKLLQALINIVSNAARYAREIVRFHTYEHAGGDLHRDRG